MNDIYEQGFQDGREQGYKDGLAKGWHEAMRYMANQQNNQTATSQRDTLSVCPKCQMNVTTRTNSCSSWGCPNGNGSTSIYGET